MAFRNPRRDRSDRWTRLAVIICSRCGAEKERLPATQRLDGSLPAWQGEITLAADIAIRTGSALNARSRVEVAANVEKPANARRPKRRSCAARGTSRIAGVRLQICEDAPARRRPASAAAAFVQFATYTVTVPVRLRTVRILRPAMCFRRLEKIGSRTHGGGENRASTSWRGEDVASLAIPVQAVTIPQPYTRASDRSAAASRRRSEQNPRNSHATSREQRRRR